MEISILSLFSDFLEAVSFDCKMISDDDSDPVGLKPKIFSPPPVHLQRFSCSFMGFLSTRTVTDLFRTEKTLHYFLHATNFCCIMIEEEDIFLMNNP